MLRRGSAGFGRARPLGRAPEAGADGPVIRRAALDLLARREHSVAELQQKLQQKFGTDAPLEPELERLVSERLLDDTRFAEAFVRMHRNRGHGPVRILHELAQRGIDTALAESTVDARSPEWVEMARALRARRFGDELPEGGTEWQRQARHLQQRGFSSEHVRAALREPRE